MTIQFFSAQDNKKNKVSPPAKKSLKLAGFITRTGVLTFPAKVLEQFGFDPQTTPLRIGLPAGKRMLKTLYLVAAAEPTADTFRLTKAVKRYRLPLGGILQQGGIDYRISKHRFTLTPFTFKEGLVGYELALTGGEAPKPKAPYTGKPRGRKPKTTQ